MSISKAMLSASPEDLVTLFVQQCRQRPQIRPLGDGGAHVSVVVEYRQPRPHAVRRPEDVVVFTLWFRSCRTTSSPMPVSSTRLTKVGRSSTLAMSSTTLRDTPPGTCSTRPTFAPAGDIGAQGIPFHIHKYGAQNHNAHLSRSFRCVVTNFDFYYTQAPALRQRKRRKPQRELRSRCGFP